MAASMRVFPPSRGAGPRGLLPSRHRLLDPLDQQRRQLGLRNPALSPRLGRRQAGRLEPGERGVVRSEQLCCEPLTLGCRASKAAR